MIFLVSEPSVSQFIGNRLPFGVPVAHAATTTSLGFDCAYGSSADGAPFPTSITTSAPYSAPDFDGSLNTSCRATELVDTDGALHPLVSDNPTAIVAAGAGGGLTIDVVAALNSTTTINGFDISVQYDPKVLNAVIIDQSGLIWGGTLLPIGGFVLTLAKTINQAAGQVRVAQVVVATPEQGGNTELFRIRFDVVGASTGTPITLFNDVLTNPGSVVHNTQNLNAPGVDTTSIYNVLNPGAVLNLAASWSFSPSPEVPGSPLTFTATATCPGCTGALTFNWDFSALDSTPAPLPVQATGSTVTITPPSPVVNRVVLTITDAGAHSMAVVRVLPLALVETPTFSTLSVNVAGPAGGFTGKWLGGVTTSTAGYSGSWRFCPGSALVTSVCSSPAPAFTQNPGAITQIATVASETYKFAGLFNDTFSVHSAANTENQLGFALDTVNIFFLANVTGTPAAFTVPVSANATSIVAGKAINFTAFSSYTSTYPSGFRSTSFKYVWNFGDGATATTTGNLTSIVHTYSASGIFVVRVVAQETDSRAVSKIQETGFLTTKVSAFPADFTFSSVSPQIGQSVTFTATVSGGTSPFTYGWDFGDSTTSTGNPVSHTYSARGTYTVNLNVTDSTGKNGFASHAVTVVPVPVVADFTFSSSSPTAGQSVTLTATVTSGSQPYTFSWDFGDGSTGTGATVSHTYTSSGTFTITLTITDGAGQTQRVKKTLTVQSGESFISTLTSPFVLAGVAAAVVLVLGLLFFFRRRRKKLVQ